MGLYLNFLLIFQALWCSSIGAPSVDVKLSMSQTILKDHLAFRTNNDIQVIWQREPAAICNIEKPPEEMLTNKRLLLFNFVPYLCVILYDTSLRYLQLNISHGNIQRNSDITQKIIDEFLPNTFCQKMKENEWFSTIEGNTHWVSSFNNDMKNKNICQRYCVTDEVNPLCAYALWLDIAIKKVENGSLHPSVSNGQESHSSSVKPDPYSKEQAGVTGEKQLVKNAPDAESRLMPNAGNIQQPASVSAQKHTVDAVTTRRFHDHLLALQHLSKGDSPVASGQRLYSTNIVPYPAQTINANHPETHVLTGNNHEHLEQIKTKKTSGPADAPSHPNVEQDVQLPQTKKEIDNPIVPNQPTFQNSDRESINEEVMKDPLKQNQIVKPSVSKAVQLNQTNLATTSLVNHSHKTGEAAPEGPLRTSGGNSPAEDQGEIHTEDQKLESVENKASANLVEPVSGGQNDVLKIDLSANSPIPSTPESSKIPVPSEDKTDKVRVDTADPEKDTKEVSGSTKGESTEAKVPALDQIAKSQPEAANQAIEGDNGGKTISGEPDDHEQQNALDDGVAESQVENGDVLGSHGSDQIPDNEEAGIDSFDQEGPATEHPRYNVADDDAPNPDGSTKLSNNNNDDQRASDEDESLWPPEQAKIPQNDADGGYAHDRFVDAEDSHFFAYFMTMIVLCIIGYLIFHNKQKILALALEGRVRKGTRRRPSTSGYRKLDSNLEEAVTSSCTGSSVTHVIY